ncbi:MAG: alpha/beta hydrolase-fold protein [Ignavibacteria bacterium]|nr:alpha/beta hydrolase-fold protein [Ignavibacteria bacterium]
MKKIFLLFLLIVQSISFSQVKVTFEITAKNLTSDEKVFISGNHQTIGNWDPKAIPLELNKKNIWTKKISFPKGIKVEFKLTKGSWETESQIEPGVNPENYSFTTNKDTAISITINHWRDQNPPKIFGQITGKVEYLKNIVGKGILPRDVIIWFPPSYDESSSKRYPVLYIHDGQNIIDPATSAFGIDWQVDETSDSLIKENLMNEIIVVGIYNTAQRRSDYSNNDTGYAYMRWVVNELKPLIDKTYRTKPDRENTAVAGSSMGGLISFMMLWEYSDIFSKAACFSPALKIDRFDFVKNVRNFNGKKKIIKIYIDNGGAGLEARLQSGIDEMIEVLSQKGYEVEKDIMFFVDKEAEHNESAWGKRIYKPLLWFFGKENKNK